MRFGLGVGIASLVVGAAAVSLLIAASIPSSTANETALLMTYSMSSALSADRESDIDETDEDNYEEGEHEVEIPFHPNTMSILPSPSRLYHVESLLPLGPVVEHTGYEQVNKNPGYCGSGLHNRFSVSSIDSCSSHDDTVHCWLTIAVGKRDSASGQPCQAEDEGKQPRQLDARLCGEDQSPVPEQAKVQACAELHGDCVVTIRHDLVHDEKTRGPFALIPQSLADDLPVPMERVVEQSTVQAVEFVPYPASHSEPISLELPQPFNSRPALAYLSSPLRLLPAAPQDDSSPAPKSQPRPSVSACSSSPLVDLLPSSQLEMSSRLAVGDRAEDQSPVAMAACEHQLPQALPPFQLESSAFTAPLPWKPEAVQDNGLSRTASCQLGQLQEAASTSQALEAAWLTHGPSSFQASALQQPLPQLLDEAPPPLASVETDAEVDVEAAVEGTVAVGFQVESQQQEDSPMAADQRRFSIAYDPRGIESCMLITRLAGSGNSCSSNSGSDDPRFDVDLVRVVFRDGSAQLAVRKTLWLCGDDSRGQAVMEAEARGLLASCGSPFLVGCLGGRELPDRWELLTDFAEGGSLEQEMDTATSALLHTASSSSSSSCSPAAGPLLPLSRLRCVAASALLALTHLHSRGVPHLHVRPANMLISAEGRVRLAGNTGDAASAAPHDCFSAPELLLSSHPPAALLAKADVFSVGAVVAVCAFGRVGCGTGSRYAQCVCEVPEWAPEALVSFVRALMAADPAARPTASE
ncbi:hypothetical protein Agub_g10891, partial [Astrephomene gubernaculifera]